MLIAAKHMRPKTPIELGNTNYFFLPREPGNPESEHVAEVTDVAHIQRFLSITEGYYLPVDQTQSGRPTPSPAAPAIAVATTVGQLAAAVTPVIDTATPPAIPETPSPPIEGTGPLPEGATVTTPVADPPAPLTPPADVPKTEELTAEIQEAAKNLLALSWQKLQAELAKGGIPGLVVTTALDLEKARPDEEQRATVLKVLTKHLAGA